MHELKSCKIDDCVAHCSARYSWAPLRQESSALPLSNAALIRSRVHDAHASCISVHIRETVAAVTLCVFSPRIQ